MAKGLFEIQEDDIRHRDLKGKYVLSWTEETLELKSKRIEQTVSRNYLGTSITKKKIKWLILTIVLVLGIVLGKIFYLQIFQGKHYRALAEGNRIRIKPVVSERGIIYDRDLKELTQNIPNFSLALIPQDLPADNTLEGKLARKKIIKEVVSLSGVSTEKIENLLDKYGSYSYASLVIKENLDYDTALKIYIASQHLPGVSIERGSKRKYLINENTQSASSSISLSHVLGYLGKLNEQEYKDLKDNGYLLFDNIGKNGLEKTYETMLRGTYGRKKVEVDAGGHEKQVLAEEAPQAGKNLILSLDLDAQVKLENLIKDTLQRLGKKRAAGIAMDPRDGSILALVSWPSFNNNDFSGGIEQDKYQTYLNDTNRPLFNRAISGTYPSGSTVKMVVAAAALQEGLINYNTTFLSQGGLQVSRWFFPDWQAGGHGLTNVTKAIAWSVNTFFYYVGGGYNDFVGLGIERLSQYMKMFNLSQRTGIDLPGEADGFIPSKEWKKSAKNEDWYVGDTYNLSIGQGDLLVTPLQVAVWTAAVANGGTVVQPHLLDKVEDATKDSTDKVQYNYKKINVSQTNMSIVKQGMRECVTYGSCGYLANLPFMAAGKTGTAQWNQDDSRNHAWFTSFAPYDNPKIVVTIIVEEGESGSSAAQPIAQQFLQWWGQNYLY